MSNSDRKEVLGDNRNATLGDINRVEDKLSNQIKELEDKLSNQIKELKDKLSNQIKELEDKLTNEIKEVSSDVRKLTHEISEMKTDVKSVIHGRDINLKTIGTISAFIAATAGVIVIILRLIPTA